MRQTKNKDFITLDDILVLLKQRLNLDVSKAAVYGYISRKGFPQNIGLGSPRIWRRGEVEKWIAGYEKI